MKPNTSHIISRLLGEGRGQDTVLTQGKSCVWNPDIVIERFREEAKVYGVKWAKEKASERFLNCENPRIEKIVNSWEMPRVNDAAQLWASVAAGEYDHLADSATDRAGR